MLQGYVGVFLEYWDVKILRGDSAVGFRVDTWRMGSQ